MQAVAESSGPDTPDRAHPAPSSSLQPPSLSGSDGPVESIIDPNSAAAADLGFAAPQAPRACENGKP